MNGLVVGVRAAQHAHRTGEHHLLDTEQPGGLENVVGAEGIGVDASLWIGTAGRAEHGYDMIDARGPVFLNELQDVAETFRDRPGRFQCGQAHPRGSVRWGRGRRRSLLFSLLKKKAHDMRT